MTLTAFPITSAGRFPPLGPVGISLRLFDLVSSIAERYENCVRQKPTFFGLTMILRPACSIITCWILNVCRENGFLNDTANFVN